MKLLNLKEIKIGGIVYRVEYKELEEEMGKTTYGKQLIEIDSRQTKEQQEATLWHEIWHCQNNQRTEVEVEGLAQAIYQIIKDNKL